MRSAHHLLQMPHIGRKERSKLIPFCDHVFLSGKCSSKPLRPDDLSNSEQLEKAWAWKQTNKIDMLFLLTAFGETKSMEKERRMEMEIGIFFPYIPVEEGWRICYSIYLLLKWLLFAWALMFQKTVSSLNDVGTYGKTDLLIITLFVFARWYFQK